MFSLLQNRYGKFQFSKVITLISLLIGILGIIGTIICSLLFSLDSVVATSAIAFFGSLGITSIVFYMKKSQNENSVSTYVDAYKDIISYRKSKGLDNTEIFDKVEGAMLQNLDDVAEAHMDDANQIIEKVDLGV